MRVLVTGSEGYVGSVLVNVLADRGHDVVRLDSGLFADCTFPGGVSAGWQRFTQTDIRLIRASAFAEVDAVIHLAALSNDPLGELDARVTQAINTEATLRLATQAREAGLSHLVFASSCSVYGPGAGEAELTERSPVRPLTAYARSKIEAERRLASTVGAGFGVTAVRAATVFGESSRLRLDLAINELVASAVAGKQPTLRSTGNAWRPFVHIHDLAHAYAEIVECGPSGNGLDVFNVGSPGCSARIVDVASRVSSLVGVPFAVSDSAVPDERNYRVSFQEFSERYPKWSPIFTIEDGVRRMASVLSASMFTLDDLSSSRYRRLPRLQEMIAEGRVDGWLRVLAGHRGQHDERRVGGVSAEPK